MTMQTPPRRKPPDGRVVGTASLVIGVALFLFVGPRAGMRWLGGVMLVGAVMQIVQRRIGYGWEGREPLGYISGIPAVVLGILLGVFGAAMLAQPDLMLEVLGWDEA